VKICKQIKDLAAVIVNTLPVHPPGIVNKNCAGSSRLLTLSGPKNRAERTDSEGCPAVSAYTGAVEGAYPDEDMPPCRPTCFSSILCALVTL